MQDGILFDNILIAGDEKTAETYRDTNWKPKFTAEKEKQKAKEAALSDGGSGIQKKFFELLYKVADISFLEPYKPKIYDMIQKAEEQPTITISVLVSIIVVVFSILLKIVFGGKKPAPPKVQKAQPATPEPTKTKENTEGKEEEKDKDDGEATRRKTRRED